MGKAWIMIAVLTIAAGLVLYVRNPKFAGTQSNPTPVPTNAAAVQTSGEFDVSAEEVTYYRTVKGLYAAPTQEGAYPGIIVIHEWWGLNDHIKDMAKKLAGYGYRVLAVDLYDGVVAKDAAQARQLTSALDQKEAVKNMQAALLYLKDRNATKLASFGWCFGGGQSMQLSVSDTPLDATVIYYGTLETDQTKLSKINWPVLGVFGDKDTSIPVSKVKEFEAALDKLEITKEIYVYPNVGHAFANPSGASYAPRETQDAWNKTVAFLDRYLKH